MNFKYAGTGGAGAGFGKPDKIFKGWNLVYDFISSWSICIASTLPTSTP